MAEKIFGLTTQDAAQPAIGATVGSTSRIGGWGDTNNLGGIGGTFGSVARGLNIGTYRYATGATGTGPMLEYIGSGGHISRQWQNNFGLNQTSPLLSRGQINVNDYFSLQMALADTQLIATDKIINLINDITIAGNLGAQVVTGKIIITGAKLIFSTAASQITLNTSSSIDFYNEVAINASCTPFGTNTPTLLRFRNLSSSGTFTCTLPTAGSKLYEKATSTLTVTNGTQSYWDNTFVPNASTPLVQAISTYDLSRSDGTASMSIGLNAVRILAPAGGTLTKLRMYASTTLGTAILAGVYSFNSGTGVCTKLADCTIPTGNGFLVGTLSTPVNIVGGTEYWVAIGCPFSGLTAFLTATPVSALYNGSAPLYYSNVAIGIVSMPTTFTVTSASYAALSQAWCQLGV